MVEKENELRHTLQHMEIEDELRPYGINIPVDECCTCIVIRLGKDQYLYRVEDGCVDKWWFIGSVDDVLKYIEDIKYDIEMARIE